METSKYVCNVCFFKTDRKANYDRHINKKKNVLHRQYYLKYYHHHYPKLIILLNLWIILWNYYLRKCN